ncbi:hypothetical protein [Rheinheimera salexigens]|uniref:Uncharacterized protein n=1 Tax=Rheinheimera salexigens TaxID=1628148 RepID=A0A1E7Q389_9GAMM|nr:hypothetical protein [Rheinheimera salexigens]OEY68645.1 hypothetical protein BI198_02945 [Rheinheimera salexigens]
MALFIILAVLLVGLVLVVSLTEKFGKKSDTAPSKISAFIIPLLIIMVTLQVLRALFWPDGF